MMTKFIHNSLLIQVIKYSNSAFYDISTNHYLSINTQSSLNSLSDISINYHEYFKSQVVKEL